MLYKYSNYNHDNDNFFPTGVTSLKQFSTSKKGHPLQMYMQSHQGTETINCSLAGDMHQ